MRKSRENKARALRKVGVSRKLVEQFRKSANNYLFTYTGRDFDLITDEVKLKIAMLIERRKKYGVEVAGVLIEGNFEVTFIFYVNDDPEDAWFERTPFSSYECFEEEMSRQLNPFFYPDMSKNKHVIAPDGIEVTLFR